MLKRAFSITLIFIFLTMSAVITPLCNSGYFAYADSQLTDKEKAELGFSTYVNYRNGWFTSSNNASVVCLLKTYIDEYFNSDANTTDIKSYSDFANEITVGTNNDGNWYVKLSDDGITFLDHLCKYLLGKNKFPNLYSGGSWGSRITNDNAYTGYLLGNNILYVINASQTYSGDSFTALFNSSDVIEGNAVNGVTYDYALSQWRKINSKNNGFDFTNLNSSTSGLSNGSITINYSSDFYANLTTSVYRSTTNMPDFSPCLSIQGISSYDEKGIGSSIWYSIRIKKILGNPAVFCIKYNGVNSFFYGFVSHNYTDNVYYFKSLHQIVRNDTVPTPTAVDLDTDNFVHNDISDGSEKVFTPEHSADEGSSTVYNYYNNTTYETENEFYNTYITNYRNHHTIIEKPDEPEDPDEPEEPDTPGGTTPPWNSSQSGTITPNGNGGYDLSLPDLTLPDLNIDWSLSGLTQKFPFSIPFDLLAFFTVLNAEPETPEIQAQVDLGIIDWDIDWSLEEFDGLAALLRNLEFIGFCIALILITRNIIKG